MAQPVVLFDTRTAANGKRVGFATLNAERSLNALSFEMAELLSRQLDIWRDDPTVACVVLEGAGDKAFCAGGDIVALYKAMSQPDVRDAQQQIERYFIREYTLDYQIHVYPKPVLCWGHGIVMGGGLGLMIGSSHRVVTEAARVATPEVTIGLYPDVAGSWFLPRMPGRTGLYVGLTGAHLNAADALFGSLADFYIQNSERARVYEQLLQLEWTDAARLNRCVLSEYLRTYRDKYTLPESTLRTHFDAINQVTDHDSVEEILHALIARAEKEPWLQRAAQTLSKGSPTSAKVIYEAYHRAQKLSLKEVFALELIMTVQCALHPDLREGVRALLIDKDNRPRWSPATLAEVSESYVEEYFTAPWPADQHPFRNW